MMSNADATKTCYPGAREW